jgi:glycosyltransferase involved in cell wall biosynthesis
LQDRKVLLTLARLSASERYKGIDEVLECLPALVRRVPALSYVIAGDGDDRARLMEKCRALEVADRVIFAGRIPEEEKADYYGLADAFVMPSRGEGFGIVFLEALACGVPVVASTLDASREAVEGSGLSVLVDPRDPADLQQGILRALALPRADARDFLAHFSRPAFERRVHTLLDYVRA